MYNYLIRGNQCCLIDFSLTNKLVLVIGYKNSCYKCSRALTKLIKHEGVCYRNKFSGPAIVEELACLKKADLLLNDNDGNPSPYHEAIFGEEVITDGGTGGYLKFIAKQNKIIGENADNIGRHIPNIGSFIKCISNRFYKGKTKNKEFSGVGLLDPQHIRLCQGTSETFMLLRLALNFLTYQKKQKSKLWVYKKVYLQIIDLIIHHHSGNYRFCTKENCKYKAIEYYIGNDL